MKKNINRFCAFALVFAMATSSINSPISYVDRNIVSAATTISLNTLTAPSKAYLYNFVDANKGYQVVFNDENDYSITAGVTLNYQVYINNSSTPVATVSKSGDYIPNSVIDSLGLSIEKQHNISVKTVATWTDGTTTLSPMSSTSTFYYGKGTLGYNTGIPQVYVSTSRTSKNSGINLYTDTTKTKVDAALVVKDSNGTAVVADNFGTINVRGNSTALAAKKPYNIKFDKKQNLLGMGSAKKWSLLANIFDKTLVRNWIGLDFQRSLEESRPLGQVYTSNCTPVDLYIDGKYLGNYLLVESVETGSSRVDINIDYIDENDDPSSDFTPSTTVANGSTYQLYDVLLELANDVKDVPSRYDDEAYYFKTSKLSEIFSVNEPERSNTAYDYTAESQNKPLWLLNTQKYINDFEGVLTGNYSSAQTQFDLLAQYIDIDSFVDFYITSEYFMTKDINFSSTRFYIKNGKLFAGPLWDLDLSSGNSVDHTGYTDLYAQRFLWFQKLMTNTVFSAAVKERFKELQPQIKELYATNGTVDQAYNTILKSANKTYSVAYNGKDSTGWHLNENYGAYNSPVLYDSYIEYVDEYKAWLKNRNNWLLNVWNIASDDSDNPTDPPSEYTDCVIDNWTSVGAWSYYAGAWNSSSVQYKDGYSTDDFSIKIVSSSRNLWGIQISVPNISVIEGHNYRYTIKVTSNKAGTILSKEDVSRLKEDTTQIIAGDNIISGEFLATSNTATILLELSSGLETGTSLRLTDFSVVDLDTKEYGVELNGYQISPTAKGFKTIYSVENTINGKAVTEVGLVYALDDYATEAEMIVGSTNSTVASYAATSAGISPKNFSNSSTATSYIMTMKFDSFSATELNRPTAVRAYAKLSDGTYVYSDIYHYSIYSVADYLYNNSLMQTYASHNYLYTDILSVVNSSYKEIPFNWTNSMYK